MQQSTNAQPELESDEFNLDAPDYGPHIIDVRAHSIEFGNSTNKIFWNDPACGEEHYNTFKMEYGSSVFTFTPEPQCEPARQLKNTVIRVSFPHGYQDHYRLGRALPETTYPERQYPGAPSPFNVADAVFDGNPTSHGDCPKGCVRDHTNDLLDRTTRRPQYHTGPAWTHRVSGDGFNKFFFRSQQHYAADPRDPYHWVDLEIFDLELEEYHYLAMSFQEIRVLIGHLQSHLDGKRHLRPVHIPEVDSE